MISYWIKIGCWEYLRENWVLYNGTTLCLSARFDNWIPISNTTPHPGCFPKTVFKTNGCPVAPGDQKLSWASLIWPWASKNYNWLYKDGNFWSISGRLRQNISLKHCKRRTIWYNPPVHISYTQMKAFRLGNVIHPSGLMKWAAFLLLTSKACWDEKEERGSTLWWRLGWKEIDGDVWFLSLQTFLLSNIILVVGIFFFQI